MTTSSPGALFVVAGRPYVDSQTLHNLTRTHQVAQIADGWRVLGPDGHAVLCLGTTCPPLPEQRGALYEARATQGTRLADACATWLAHGAARLAGKYEGFAAAGSCGCGVTCGCGPCKQRHAHGHESAESNHEPRTSGVSDEDAAEYMLDVVPDEVDDYVSETEKREPSGFYVHLYIGDGDDEQRAATFEVEDKNTLRITWFIAPTSATRRSAIIRTIDLLIQEAYDEENHRDDSE